MCTDVPVIEKQNKKSCHHTKDTAVIRSSDSFAGKEYYCCTLLCCRTSDPASNYIISCLLVVYQESVQTQGRPSTLLLSNIIHTCTSNYQILACNNKQVEASEVEVSHAEWYVPGTPVLRM